MALIPKNDVNQIFGSQAPDQDKPAQFNNYTGGWDASRINNGKPTIKQFNYLQQRTDQNILYIHQNGGALPYDSTIEYAENATVLIDGELKQKKGNQWVSIGAKYDNELLLESGRTQRELNKYTVNQSSSYISATNLNSTDEQIINEFLEKDYNELVIDKKLTLSSPILITSRLNGKQIRFTKKGLVTWKDGLVFNSVMKWGLIKFSEDLANFDLIKPVCDGNKDNTTSDIDNACSGIVIDKNKFFTNVNVDNPVCRNNRGSGIEYNSGGLTITNANCYDNLWHGQGVSYTTNEITRVIGSRNVGNGGYGFDASGGNIVHDDLCYCEGNQQGGAKVSEGCNRLAGGIFYLKSNYGASSFRTTGLIPNLNISLDAITIEDHRGTAEAISIATGDTIDIKSLSLDKSIATGARIGDCSVFKSNILDVSNTNNRGVYIRNCVANIGFIKTKNTAGSGLVVDASSVLTANTITVENSNTNQSNTDKYGVIATQSSVVNVKTIKHQGSVVSGVSCTLAGVVNVDYHDTGLLTDNFISTSGIGSMYKANTSKGLVVESYETIQISGVDGQTAYTLNLAKPLTSVGGGVYTATVYGNSNDANAIPFSIYQVSFSLVRIRFNSAPTAGTNNLTFNVNVKLDRSIR